MKIASLIKWLTWDKAKLIRELEIEKSNAKRHLERSLKLHERYMSVTRDDPDYIEYKRCKSGTH